MGQALQNSYAVQATIVYVGRNIPHILNFLFNNNNYFLACMVELISEMLQYFLNEDGLIPFRDVTHFFQRRKHTHKLVEYECTE
jgi:hypothetical protein